MRFVPSICVVLSISTLSFAASDGAALYKEKCAYCHGANGEGTKKYKPALVGDRSVQQLVKYVQETMPEDNPGSLTREESEAITKYFHDAFYSPVARERNKPARVELSRLTVNQYRQTVADLVQGFRFGSKWGDQRGLKGEYSKERKAGGKAFERIDETINFDWKQETPDKEKLPDPYAFSITWTGSFLAPATGLYEFSVKTEQATRFYLNDNRKPMIDAWVKSGKDNEFGNTIHLVGGRIYPVKLEFNKANQGVNNPEKNKARPIPNANMVLMWKPPHGVKEVVPGRVLSPVVSPEQYVCSTPFPPDDRSLGWERGTSVSKEWDAAATDAALELAGYVSTRANELAKTNDTAADRPAKLKQLATLFAERAYRRPLTPEQKAIFEKPFDGAKDLELAVKTSVLLALKSPRFLYTNLDAHNDQFSIASRLALGLWDSVPDQQLIDAAARGQLSNPATLKAQADRMVADPRAKAKLKRFFEHWLLIEHAGDLAKDTKRFPGFDPAIVADLRTSLELFVEDVAWNGDGDARKLLTSPEVFLNGRLARYYGASLPGDAPFQKVPLDPGKRSGVLTHPFLMSSFAYMAETSPIHRGVFLTRAVLGLGMKPPPEAVSPIAPDLHPSLNTRERVTLQTKANACIGCHGIINDLGFALERFDAVGKFREKDNNKPVNAEGMYLAKSGQTVKFNGAVELGKFLATSPEVQDAFAEQMFHHVAYQPVRAYGAGAQEKLSAGFAKSGYNIRSLVAEAAMMYAVGPGK
jgi:hypothetical protein